MHISVNTLKTTELYTLNELTIWSVNYISIKLFKELKEKKLARWLL